MRSTGWLRVVAGVVRGTPIRQAAATLIFAVLLTTVLAWNRGAIGCKLLVIAMPEPMAKAMGYPDPRGWKDIFALATNPAGWGSKGHPEWGRFKLGKTNPHVSTSGLHALVGMYDAIQSDQNPEMVSTPAAR